jgi:hypothetical protein
MGAGAAGAPTNPRGLLIPVSFLSLDSMTSSVLVAVRDQEEGCRSRFS